MHLLLVLVVAGLAEAARKLTPPADVQVNLLFPRQNETYAPTQYFPIIFGIQNLDATGPISAFLDVAVARYEEDGSASHDTLGGGMENHFLDLSDSTEERTFDQTFFHVPITSMTNNTVNGFVIAWQLKVTHRCWDNMDDWEMNDPIHRWSNGRGDRGARQYINFFTAEGAQLPDIESALNACDEPSSKTDTAIRITELRDNREAEYAGGWQRFSTVGPCPVLDTSLEANRCAYRPFAKELAANISEDLLGRMYCKGGTWQTTQGECPPEGDAARSGVRWIFALVLAVVIGWIL